MKAEAKFPLHLRGDVVDVAGYGPSQVGLDNLRGVTILFSVQTVTLCVSIYYCI